MIKTFRELYRAPHRTDRDGIVWYECLSDMHFASPRVGWAVGSGQILCSGDGGKTWNNQYTDFMASSFFAPHRVSMPSQNSCWVIDTVGFGQNRCFHTRDGGRNWEASKFASAYPKDVFFINSQRGWLITDDGKMLSGGGSIHATIDGGKTWKTGRLKIKGRPEVIRFISSRAGWLVERVISKDQGRSIGRLHKSKDGGSTWESVATFDNRILDLAVLDQERIFVSGEGGLIAATRDAGQSWQRLRTKTHAAINSIAFDGNRTVIAAGDFRTLLISDDGGSSWSRLRTPAEDSNWVRACMVSSSQAIVASTTAIYLLNPLSETDLPAEPSFPEKVRRDRTRHATTQRFPGLQ